MKYTNCPTCGGLACYISGNFERANVLISEENRHIADEVVYLSRQLQEVTDLISSNIKDMTSDQLFALYRAKLHQEIIIDNEKKTIEARAYEIMQKDFEDGLKRMFGDV